jgi:hypothetical protein
LFINDRVCISYIIPPIFFKVQIFCLKYDGQGKFAAGRCGGKMGLESAAKNLSRGVSAYKICGEFYGPLPFIREITRPLCSGWNGTVFF